MSWLAKSIANSLKLEVDENEPDDESDPNQNPSSPSSSDPRGGVKGDLADLSKTLNRQFSGVASFLAPPPAPNPSTEQGQPSDSEEDVIAGIRSDFSEIGGRFKTGNSKLSSNINVSEFTKIASNLPQLGSEEEAEAAGLALGVTPEVFSFVRNVVMHPETWLDFPLSDDEDVDEDETTQNVQGARPDAESVASIYTALNRDELDRIVENLEEEHQIGIFRDRAAAYRRYATLRIPELATRLISLYASLFTTSWSVFKHACTAEAPTGYASKMVYLATIYITAWFWDLHVSIREAVKKTSGTAFNQYFQQEVCHIANRYDPFLQHLNTVIKPTIIHLALENTLYIPLVSLAPDWTNENFNPFGITNGIIDINILYGILEIMDNKRNEWSTVPLNTNVLGRPSWLFDYRLGQAYAWFPMEHNFTFVDLIAPHILGIPCTPRFGPRDTDEWQVFPRNETPARPNVNNYRRLSERNFYGSAEYRTLQTGTFEFDYSSILPPATAGKRTRSRTSKDTSSKAIVQSEPSDAEEGAFEVPPPVTLQRYRLIDWCYHARVIDGIDAQSRNRAFRNFIYKGAIHPK